MYTLDRTRKFKVILGIASFFSFVLSVIGYLRGGYEILEYGFMNEPLYGIMMITFFGIAIVLLLVCLVVNAIQKDISEHLKYIYKKCNQ